MLHTFRLALTTLSLLALLVPMPAFGQGKTVSDTDNGHEITLRPGDALTVHLASHGDGGYAWNLVQSPLESVVVLLGQSNVPPAQPLPGAFGTDEFRFRAGNVSKGASQAVWLRFLSLRPFEASIKDAELWQVHITVTADPVINAAALETSLLTTNDAPGSNLGRALSDREQAWARGDAAGYYAVATADYHEAGPQNHRLRRAEAERALAKFFTQQKPLSVTHSPRSIRFVTPTEARVTCTHTRETITRDAPPTRLPTSAGIILQNNATHTWLTSKERQSWVYAQGAWVYAQGAWHLRWSRTEQVQGCAVL